MNAPYSKADPPQSQRDPQRPYAPSPESASRHCIFPGPTSSTASNLVDSNSIAIGKNCLSSAVQHPSKTSSNRPLNFSTDDDDDTSPSKQPLLGCTKGKSFDSPLLLDANGHTKKKTRRRRRKDRPRRGSLLKVPTLSSASYNQARKGSGRVSLTCLCCLNSWLVKV
jgi:hypothetical protein